MTSNATAEAQIKYPDNRKLMGDTIDSYVQANKDLVNVTDPFRSLEDPFSQTTQHWVEEENNVTQKYLATLTNVD